MYQFFTAIQLYVCFYIIIVFYGLYCSDILNCARLLCIFSFHHTTKNDYLGYFVFSVAKAKHFFSFFSFFFCFMLVCLFFCICPKLRKDKSNRYVGMKRRHLAGYNLAGVHTKVDDIIPLFYLHFSNAYPIYC